MPHPLQQQLEALSQRARKLIWLHGTTRLAAIVIGAMLTLGLVDYLLRPADRGLRFVALAVVIGAIVWCVQKYLQPAWHYRPADVDMARKLERRFPQLGQRLSSATAFLGRGEQQISPGSPQLQRMLIAETTSTIESLPLAEVFDLSAVKKSLVGFLLVAIMGGVLIGLDPASASVAARRLLVPWSETPWPRRNYLELISPPSTIARGEALELEARDTSGRQPDDVELQWRPAADTFSSSQTRPMKLLNDRYVVRLENITEALDYRVVGGDDQNMAWQRLEVIDLPQLKQLTLTVTPPEYTQIPPYESAPEARVLAGSEIVMQGTADRPLEKTELMAGPQQSDSRTGKLATNNLSFTLPASKTWQPQESGEYVIRLTETGQREVAAEFNYSLEVVPDRVPSASFRETPPGNAAAAAVLPLVIGLDDDLRVVSARLIVRRANQPESEPVVIEVYESPAGPPAGAASNQADFLNTPWREQIEYEWDLSALARPDFAPLQAGEAITYQLEATDSLGQTGRSGEQRLNVISAEELDRRLGRQLTAIEGKLAEALRIESELVGGTEQIRLQLTQVGTAGSGDLDQLQSVELRQRQVEALLVSRADSGLALVREALAEIQQNRLDQPATSERLEEYHAVISQLAKQELPAASRELIASLKQLRADLQQAEQADPAARISLGQGSQATLAASLGSALQQERAIVAALEELLGSLARWSDFHRFAEELGAIRRQQEQLLADTLKVRPDTIGRDRRDMSSQLVAELDKLTLRQRELARRFEQLQGQMQATARELADADAATAARLTDVFDEATSRGTASKLRDASGHIDSNRLGTASDSQQQTIADIEHLLGMLTGRKETDLEKVADSLNSEAEKIDDLANKAADLENKAAAAGKQPEGEKREQELAKLDQEKKELAKEIDKARRRLERLDAKEPAAEAAAAADALGGGEGEKSNADGLHKEAQEAKERLKKAKQQLEDKAKQAEQDLFHEQIAKLEQTLVGLTERERSIAEEIVRLQTLREEQGELSAAQQASVAALAAEQRIVQQETESAAAGLQKAAVFQLSLAGIARAMSRTAEGLEAQQTDQQVMAAAQEALTRLEQLAEALQPEPPPPADDNNGGGGDQPEQPPQDNTPPIDGVKLMAEVKLLKLMQVEINRRTLEIEQQRSPTGELSERLKQEIDALAQEQGHLADLFAKMLAALQGIQDAEGDDSPSESPDSAPETEPMPDEEPENTQELEKELDELLEDLE